MNAIDNGPCYILTLPNEMLVNILERVPDPALSLVCKKFREILNANSVRQTLLRLIEEAMPYSNFLPWQIKGYSSLPVDIKVRVAYASFLDITRQRNPMQHIGKSNAAVLNHDYFALAIHDQQMAEYITLITFCRQFLPGSIAIDPIVGSKFQTDVKRTAIARKIENVLAPGLLGINFSFRNLIEIPREISLFSNVTSLDVSNNLLKFLPEEIGALRRLELFNAPNNHIEFIPETVWNLRTLTNLNVSNNPIGVISEGIGNLENLVTLDLSHLKIETLPQSLRNLGRLTVLWLNQNPFLREFSETIQLPDSLRVLHLNSCTSLKRLPLWIGNLPRLETLLLHNTPIEQIPELRSPELKLLSFPQNVSQLPYGMNLSRFPNLNTVNIYKCQKASIGISLKRMFPGIKIKIIDKEPRLSIGQRVRGWLERD